MRANVAESRAARGASGARGLHRHAFMPADALRTQLADLLPAARATTAQPHA